jgi:hypothetical protein
MFDLDCFLDNEGADSSEQGLLKILAYIDGILCFA